VPPPRRGEAVRRFGVLLREHKDVLGTLVALENGKIKAEGDGEVQEMIDIADFAVGLSRQLYGLTMHSERPGHRLMEQWLPLGPTVVITAFNFPVAVWAWNAALALVCGNPVIWKPSELTPLTALATDALLQRAAAEVGAPDLGIEDLSIAVASVRAMLPVPLGIGSLVGLVLLVRRHYNRTAVLLRRLDDLARGAMAMTEAV
jgi:aldehyde dehydrogenase (NAD+)